MLLSQSSSPLLRYIRKYSFYIPAFILFVIESMNILKGNWSGDFWEHSAVVKTLSEDLLSPSHPLFKADAPHHFFSPYAVLVATFAKISGLNAIEGLQYFAFFNLAFLLFSFYRFCNTIFKNEANFIATIGLVLILFFWGKAPFGWSGFYHFMVLHSVLPYPSTFAMALSFLTLSFILTPKNQSYFNIRTILIVLLNTIVLLVHPNTGLFLFIVIIASDFCISDYSIKYTLIRSAILIIPAVLLSFLWPYFSMFDLLFGDNEDFHLASIELYRSTFKISWPVLLVVPGLFLIKRDKIVYFFLISLFIMIGAFFLGYIAHVYGVSRLISTIMMFSQLLLAYFIVRSVLGRKTMFNKLYLSMVIVCFCAALFINRKLINHSLHIPSGHFYKKYEFLRTMVKTDEVILSDRLSNTGIPSFNGKIISTDKPVYWIPDIKERREAMRIFFTKKSPDSLRQIVIEKFKPDYILLDHTRLDFQHSTIQWMYGLGEVVYKSNMLELIRLKK